MEEHVLRRILGAMQMTDSDEIRAARVLVETGEALARGDTAPLEALQKAFERVSDTAAVKACILVGSGVVFEVSRASIQTGKVEGELEGFERGWKRGFDKGFLAALRITRL